MHGVGALNIFFPEYMVLWIILVFLGWKMLKVLPVKIETGVFRGRSYSKTSRSDKMG